MSWTRIPNQVPKSSPPSGKYKIVNIYVDPETGKIVVEYDNNRVE